MLGRLLMASLLYVSTYNTLWENTDTFSHTQNMLIENAHIPYQTTKCSEQINLHINLHQGPWTNYATSISVT